MSFPSTIRSKILALRSFKQKSTTTTPDKLLPSDRILILTGSIGAGHLSIAKAVAEHMHQADVVDIIGDLHTLVTRIIKKIYLGSLKVSSKIYKLIFSGSDAHSWPLEVLAIVTKPFMEEKLLTLLRERRPHILVSTFPVLQKNLRDAWDEYRHEMGLSKSNAPFITIVTDSISVHTAWLSGAPDHYIVPNNDTKNALRHLGVPQKIIHAFGLPILKDHSRSITRNIFLKQHGLDPKKKTLLVILPTGMHAARMKTVVRAIQKTHLTDIQLIIVAYGSPRWKTWLSRLSWPVPVSIHRWSDQMPAMQKAADVILSKAGGATTMECIALQKPMIILDVLPGQEAGNAALVQRYGLGVILNKKADNFDEAVTYVLSHEKEIQQNCRKQHKPDAGRKIAEFLRNII